MSPTAFKEKKKQENCSYCFMRTLQIDFFIHLCLYLYKCYPRVSGFQPHEDWVISDCNLCLFEKEDKKGPFWIYLHIHSYFLSLLLSVIQTHLTLSRKNIHTRKHGKSQNRVQACAQSHIQRHEFGRNIKTNSPEASPAGFEELLIQRDYGTHDCAA